MPPKKQKKLEEDITSLSKPINFYEVMPKEFLHETENPNYHLHNLKLPFRALIVAPSGSGKTNFLLNLIKLHEKETQSVYSKKIIQQWSNEKSNFYQVCPKEMLNKLKQPLSNKAVHGKAV